MRRNTDTLSMHESIGGVLGETTKQLTLFLGKILPSILENWWKIAVLNSLSPKQQERLRQRNITSLASLDLAALLQVLDQNWYQISTKLGLPSEVRHFIKEMQTVRNRWAHAGSEGFPVKDVYRDLDTLQRFALIIEAKDLSDKISILMNALLMIQRGSEQNKKTGQLSTPEGQDIYTNDTTGQMNFYVYENWTAEHKAVIHRADCGFCNNGKGSGRNKLGNKNGRWHGPFDSLTKAERAAISTGRTVKQDRCVK